MITHEQGSGEKAGMKEDRADFEKLLALAASEVVRKRSKADAEAASEMQMAIGGSSRR
jgi:hypothetical protein